MAEQTCPCCGANLRISCNTAHPEHDCYHPDGHERPQPDWADLREMARNAGWTQARGFSDRGDAWLPPSRDGYRQEQDGWVIFEHRDRLRGVPVVSLVGVGKYPKRTACLPNPTPAEVLTAARLVGLIGGTS